MSDPLFPLVLKIDREPLTSLPQAEVGGLDLALDVLQRRADRMLAAAGPELPKADRPRGGANRRTG